MAVVNIPESLRDAIEMSLEKHCPDEDIEYALSLNAFPNPQMKDTFIGALAFHIQVKGSILGSRVSLTALLPTHLPLADVDGQVRELVQKLFEGRSQQLETMQHYATEAHANGRPAPTGGLILPS